VIARRILAALLLTVVAVVAGRAAAEPQPKWLTLPPTPVLPRKIQEGHVTNGGAELWYAEFGAGLPVVLLHGGLASSDYWGLLVDVLAKRYRVIVMDSRGHGRSTRDTRPLTYGLMAGDVVALLDHLAITKAAIVGWSDGAILGLLLAIEHPERVSRVFAFAANTDPSAVMDAGKSPLFGKYMARAAREYIVRSPTPTAFEPFRDAVTTMWETQPHITREQLRGIKAPTWIVDGDRDELIKRENTEYMAAEIPNAGLLILPEVGHFALLQDAEQFNDAVLHFLAAGSPTKPGFDKAW
jgi:pimeloyl-ACP methyl ester carboxylesterase